MPLSNGYGVVIGTKHRYYRDKINDYGQYFHGNLEVATPMGIYRCAIDVDSKLLPNGVQWAVVELREDQLKGIASMSDGWHTLASNSVSGALDYLREPALRCLRLPWLGHLLALTGRLSKVGTSSKLTKLRRFRVWKSGTSIDALVELEPLLEASQRLFIFGEPFTTGLGVHNIHQNQGDPVGSQWSNENGIWQSGATIVQRIDGSYAAFLNKFKTQATRTDNNGHPL